MNKITKIILVDLVIIGMVTLTIAATGHLGVSDYLQRILTLTLGIIATIAVSICLHQAYLLRSYRRTLQSLSEHEKEKLFYKAKQTWPYADSWSIESDGSMVKRIPSYYTNEQDAAAIMVALTDIDYDTGSSHTH